MKTNGLMIGTCIHDFEENIAIHPNHDRFFYIIGVKPISHDADFENTDVCTVHSLDIETFFVEMHVYVHCEEFEILKQIDEDFTLFIVVDCNGHIYIYNTRI
jgi:hypothetical protein